MQFQLLFDFMEQMVFGKYARNNNVIFFFIDIHFTCTDRMQCILGHFRSDSGEKPLYFNTLLSISATELFFLIFSKLKNEMISFLSFI